MEVLSASRLVVAATAYLLSTSLLLLLISPGPQATEGQKFEQYCKFTPQHTLCMTTGLGKACGQQVPARGVSAQDAAVIVAQHNQLRARVAFGQETKGAPGPQPKAANMLQMAWDEELSLIAQRHTDQCIDKHDCNECRQVERFRVGQNLFMSSQSDMDPAVDWPRVMQEWYKEVDLFANSGVDSYKFNKGTGHYTALLWSSTNLVGCGFTMFEEGGWYNKLITCNYGPVGNIRSSAMYQRGEPCFSCPEGTSCSLAYPGLCAKNLPNTATNALAPLIATTKPLLDFVYVDGSSAEDLVLRLHTPPGQGISGIPGHSELLAEEDSSMALANAGLDGVNTLLLTNPDAVSNNSPKSLGETSAVQSLGSPNQGGGQGRPNQGGAKNHPEPTPHLPRIDNIQDFLMNFGKSSQVIRTNSLDSVKAIINALPQDTKPLVFFRKMPNWCC